jgi:hypothetical protein
MIAAPERRISDRRAPPTHATDGEYAVLRTLGDLIDALAPFAVGDRYAEGQVAGLTTARDAVIGEMKGQR